MNSAAAGELGIEDYVIISILELQLIISDFALRFSLGFNEVFYRSPKNDKSMDASREVNTPGYAAAYHSTQHCGSNNKWTEAD